LTDKLADRQDFDAVPEQPARTACDIVVKNPGNLTAWLRRLAGWTWNAKRAMVSAADIRP
jgi:hypothetical protein